MGGKNMKSFPGDINATPELGDFIGTISALLSVGLLGVGVLIAANSHEALPYLWLASVCL